MSPLDPGLSRETASERVLDPDDGSHSGDTNLDCILEDWKVEQELQRVLKLMAHWNWPAWPVRLRKVLLRGSWVFGFRYLEEEPLNPDTNGFVSEGSIILDPPG